MKLLWDYIIKYEFWFSVLVVVGLYFGEYRTGGIWLGSFANLLVVIAIMRLAYHPMWNKDEE